MSKWKIVWREIGWRNFNTIRQGWAAECDEGIIYCWIENEELAIHDKIGYYPTGCYDIPLNLIEELKNK